MNRGNQENSKARRKSAKKRGNERLSLLALLAVIAVLLVALISLLPETVVRDDAAAGNDAPVERAVDADQRDRAAGPTETADTEEPSETGGREPVEVGARAAPDAGVTEGYPDGEEPPERIDSDSSAESDRLHWWLPADDVPAPARGELVLVLDDAGNTLDGLSAFLSLPVPLAVAVLPRLDYSVQSAAMIAAAGKEILLHLPMEAEGGANPGPGAILVRSSSDQIALRVTENLATVPGAIGVNNHMGSLATAEPDVMRPLLSTLDERGLFFLDSRTSARTTGRAIAAEVGVPFAERAVFLDHERTRESILRSIRHALELSHRGEPVVMIGHVTVPLLASILEEVYPVIVDHGYAFRSLSSLVSPAQVASGESE